MNSYNIRLGYVTGFFDYQNNGDIKFIPIYLTWDLKIPTFKPHFNYAIVVN